MGMGTLLGTQQQGLWGIKTPWAAVGGGCRSRGRQIQLRRWATKEARRAHGTGVGQRRDPGRSDSLTPLRNTNCLSVCVHALKRKIINFLDNCAQRYCSPWADDHSHYSLLSAVAPGSLALTLPRLPACLQPSILHCWHARLICHLLKKCFVNKIQTVHLAHLGPDASGACRRVSSAPAPHHLTSSGSTSLRCSSCCFLLCSVLLHLFHFRMSKSFPSFKTEVKSYLPNDIISDFSSYK